MSENKNAKTPADDGQPVAWMMVNKMIGPPSLHWKPQEDWHITWECKPLYTAPKRKWVALTDEEIYEYADKYLYQHGSNYGIKAFGKAIEAKLKEKNA